MLCKLELNLADRQLIGRLVTELESVNLATAHTIRAIRQALDLRQAQKAVNALGRDEVLEQLQTTCTRLYEEEKERDELSEQQLRWLERMLTVEAEPLTTWDDLGDTEKKQFTLDDAYIVWIKELLEKKDWASQRVPDQRGGFQVAPVLVAPSLAEAIANLSDALNEAKSTH